MKITKRIVWEDEMLTCDVTLEHDGGSVTLKAINPANAERIAQSLKETLDWTCGQLGDVEMVEETDHA